MFRKIDHSAIYLLIAGTYTPVLMLVLDFPYSVVCLAIVWYLAISGIVFSCITLKFNSLSTALYLLLGYLFFFFGFYGQKHWFLLLYFYLPAVYYILSVVISICKRKSFITEFGTFLYCLVQFFIIFQ